MISDFFKRHSEIGLLIMRVGIGGTFMYHGWPKLVGGPIVWDGVGWSLAYVGITFAPEFLGFVAAFTEFVGGTCILFGVLFRQASFFICLTMAFAAAVHMGKGDSFLRASHAIELGLVTLGFVFLGPGKYRLNLRNK